MQVRPDLLSSATMSRVTMRLRGDLDRASMEMVTGERRDVTRAAGGQLGQVHRLRREAEAVAVLDARLGVTAGRLDTASAALSSLRRSVGTLGLEAMNAAVAGGAAGLQAYARGAEETLRGAVSTLSVRFDGRSLFAGAAGDGPTLVSGDALVTAVRAVTAATGSAATREAAVNAYFAPGGGFDAAYLGSDDPASDAPLPDGSRLADLPRANDPAVRDVLRGLALIAASEGLPEAGAVRLAEAGAAALRAGSEGLVAAEAGIGLSLERVEAARTEASEASRRATSLLSRLTGRDSYEAASEVQQLESRVQAAYEITARIGRLSLTSFLR